MEINLSNRLYQVANFAMEDEPVLDVGSDHAYLPIYLIQQGIVPYAIAGEVAEGPFHHAQETVRTYNLEEQIAVRLGDGLNVLQEGEEVGTVFICGMGGSLISKILSNGIKNHKLSRNSRLVLQPNSGEARLRKALIDAQYEITEEVILEENGKFYEIIIAEASRGEVHYTDEEIFFGPELLKEHSSVLNKKWKQELLKNEHIYEQIKQSDNKAKMLEFEETIQKIKRVIR